MGSSKVKVIFLGTNGWYSTLTGNTVSVLIETGERWIIFDAGDGLCKADRFINDDKPIHLFISHLHLDHIIGLHALCKFRFKQGITVFGPAGFERKLRGVICNPYSVGFDDLPYPVEFRELKEGSHNLGHEVLVLKLTHSVECLGYRDDLDGRAVSYCLDTGPCANATRLGASADLLITECSLKSGESGGNWPHMNPETAATLARDSHASKLAIIHFNPFLFPSFSDRLEIETTARRIFPQTFCMRDNEEIVL